MLRGRKNNNGQLSRDKELVAIAADVAAAARLCEFVVKNTRCRGRAIYVEQWQLVDAAGNATCLDVIADELVASPACERAFALLRATFGPGSKSNGEKV